MFYVYSIVAAESRECKVTVSTEPQYIINKLVQEQSVNVVHCGHKSQPWTVETLTGQRIHISLLDFMQQSTRQGWSRYILI